MSSPSEDNVVSLDEPVDIGSLLRGTGTFTFVVEIVSAIMMFGSGVAYSVSRSGFIETLDIDLAILLLMLGSMITLFIFLGAIGFFIRFSRRINRAIVGQGIEDVDLNRPRVKTVVSIYGLAVGLILIMGMYSFWLLWKHVLAVPASTSLSVFGFSLGLGAFVVAFLIQIVVFALGRTATRIVKAVLTGEE
ncbi:hypothetical protein EU537_12355 [Candidatus Thorarchaeota archaeon]|nr:MAG: hypothetical protein EU537_12355 [Candidatus Thorarchaeota archaeon]